MGTNYYIETDFCKCCGKPKSRIHIGKASASWKFLFHKQPLINNFKDVKELITQGCIINEYGEHISSKEFLNIVEKKQKEQEHGELVIDGYDFCEMDFR